MLNVKTKKVEIDNSRTELCKKMFKIYIYWVKKKTCLGCFRIEETVTKTTKQGWKREEEIEMSIYSAFFRFCIYLPSS